jgi:hypothetical protein
MPDKMQPACPDLSFYCPLAVAGLYALSYLVANLLLSGKSFKSYDAPASLSLI